MSVLREQRFDVALSFAGEDRRHAKQLAELLQRRGIVVFYDEFEKAALWGKDLYQHFNSVYRDRARYCIILISCAYARKYWTRHELRQAQARAFCDDQEYLLPLRLDETEIPGVNPTTGYLDLRNTPMETVAALVADKLWATSDWVTWPDTPVHIEEFGVRTRDGVAAMARRAGEAITLVDTAKTTGAVANLVQASLSRVPRDSHNDIELTCLDDAGVFVHHPWPGIIGKTLESQWNSRPGFASWVLQTVRERRRGYLTWKDTYSSDPDLEIEITLQNRRYSRRTIMGFERLTIGQCCFTVAVEGHEIENIGSLFAFVPR
ncbi:MAG: TIR domain-containing protein [Bryobacterales bacterium]|nr:TIR domain-containing protein [Bryobacterales bacterium]